MRVGEVARAAGLRASAIRFYERRGLLPEPARTSAGYRDYDPEIVDRLRFIRAGQQVGLTLSELRDVIAMRDQGRVPCAHVLDLLEARTQQLDAEIRHLRSLQGELRTLVERGRLLDPADCDGQGVCHVVSRPDS